MRRLSINFEKIFAVPMGSLNSTIRSWSSTQLLLSLLLLLLLLLMHILINEYYNYCIMFLIQSSLRTAIRKKMWE